jgi:hypothetical protein
VISCFSDFRIFRSFSKFCPDYATNYATEIEALLQKEDNFNAIDLLDEQMELDISNVCLVMSLSDFIEKTKRKRSLTQKDFIEKQIKYSTGTPKSKQLKDETDKFKKLRQRITKNKTNISKRDNWHSIPASAEHPLSITYPILFGQEDNFRYRAVGRLNTLYDKILNAYRSPKDENYQVNLNAACKKALSAIRKLEYESFIKQGEYFLNKVFENKKFYGLSLCGFEKDYGLYRTANEVKHLSQAEDMEEMLNILGASKILNDIYFPHLYVAFSFIDNESDMIRAVGLFSNLLEIIATSSKLILDGLIEEGYFGNDDFWYGLFLDAINELAEDVFYSQSDIEEMKEATTPASQKCFEAVLSFPVALYLEDDECIMTIAKALSVIPQS